MEDLTLQVLVNGGWQDAALLEFRDPDRGTAGTCAFTYHESYFLDHIQNDRPVARVGARYPIQYGPLLLREWPALLDDLRPLGSAEKWWRRRLSLPDTRRAEFTLLAKAATAPIGNVRIKEAVPPEEGSPMRFPASAVIEREHQFLEYAASHGAQIGGATGAGGDAPKVLLRKSNNNEVWVDTWQNELDLPDEAYLVKFARGNRSLKDQQILRAEAVYYRALHALGLDTVDADRMTLEEGDNGPSLWLPRFDFREEGGRCGVETISSLLDTRPGDWLYHEDVLEVLKKTVTGVSTDALVAEYIKRDLLNMVFANSDNHGRNMSVVRTETDVALAPIYDFAPMKMDPVGIIRTTRWREAERNGHVDYQTVIDSQGNTSSTVRCEVNQLAKGLVDLPELLGDLGLEDDVLQSGVLGLRNTRQKLEDWGLL